MIEGASEGAGLGHHFLRHIERTRLIVHMIDASGFEGRDPVEDYYAIRTELAAYSQALAEKQEIVVAAKMDIPGAEVGLEMLQAELEPKGIRVYPISAATTQGVKELIEAVALLLREIPAPQPIEEEGVLEEWENYDSQFSYELTRGEDGIAEINGSLIEIFLNGLIRKIRTPCGISQNFWRITELCRLCAILASKMVRKYA